MKPSRLPSPAPGHRSSPALARAALALLALAVAPALALAPAPARAERPLYPLAGESPTLGVHLPTPSLVGGTDPAGIELNPASTAFLDSWAFMYHHAELKQSGRIDGNGDAFLMATPLPFFSSVVFGIGLQWLRPADAIGYADYFKLSFSGAYRLSGSLSTGFAIHTFIAPDDPGGLHHLTTLDLGLTLRPFEWLAAGAVVHDVTGPRWQGLPIQRVYDLELAVRPLRSNRLELGVGLAIGERRGDLDPHFRIETEPVRGFQLFGDLRLVTRDFYRDGGSFTDVRGTVGFGFSLEHIGVAVSTVAARTLDPGPGALAAEPARSSFHGIEATLRLQGSRRTPLVELGKKLLYVKLDAELSQRKLIELVGLLRRLEERDDFKGLYLELDGLVGGWAQMQELRAWVHRLRGKGKRVIAFLRQASQREYYLAAAADRVLVDPAGGVDLKGMAMRSMYFRGTFDLLGVSPQFVRIAEFKSAPEAYTRKGSTPAAREVSRAIFDELLGQLSSDLGRDRKKSAAEVRRLMDAGPYLPPRALAAGLVDEVIEAGEVKTAVERATGAALVRTDALRRAPERWPVGPGIAVIVVDGDIVKGKSSQIPLLGRRLEGDETIVKALAWARGSSSVRAIVIRVNSPGGSAWASDRMWREVMRTRGVKPVIVSMSDLAASGGYYIACAGDRVFAEPATLTGSIGIFTGKFDVSGLLKKIGVSTEVLASEGKHAMLDSFERSYTEEERSFVLSQLQYYYRQFLAAVSKGRNLTQDRVHEVARGRVWLGAQARGRGLVDEQGGLIEAIEEAKRRAGIPLARPTRLFVVPEETPGLLGRLVGMLTSAQASASLPEAVRDALKGIFPVLLRARSGEPLARMPFELTF